MVVIQASKLSFPNSSFSSSHITSLLFEPNSLSLALMHSDSSFSLYPSLSHLSLSSLPPPQTLVPPPSSSSAFVLIQSSTLNSDSKVLFVVSAPYMGGSQILLRFYILHNSKLFRKVEVVCRQKGLVFDQKLGVLVDVKHGLSVRLAGSVNLFAMYSMSSSRVCVFALKMVGDDGMVVKLMKYAVVECCKPIWSISLSLNFLFLGEENGVRIFNLKQDIRLKVHKVRNSSSLMGGAVWGGYERNGNDVSGCSVTMVNGGANDQCSGNDGIGSSATNCIYMDGKVDRHNSIRQRTMKLKQDSDGGGVCFVAFKCKEVEESKSVRTMSLKAISIQALSSKKFMVLDSAGDLHVLQLSKPANGSEVSFSICPLPYILKVQKLAVLPDVSSTQTVWVSDGHYSVHVMVEPDINTVRTENNGNGSEENLMQLSGFMS